MAIQTPTTGPKTRATGWIGSKFVGVEAANAGQPAAAAPTGPKTRATGWIGSTYVGGPGLPATPGGPMPAPATPPPPAPPPAVPSGGQDAVTGYQPTFDSGAQQSDDPEVQAQYNRDYYLAHGGHDVNTRPPAPTAPVPPPPPPSSSTTPAGYQTNWGGGNTEQQQRQLADARNAGAPLGFDAAKWRDETQGTSQKYTAGRILAAGGTIDDVLHAPDHAGWTKVSDDKIKSPDGNIYDVYFDYGGGNQRVQYTLVGGPRWDAEQNNGYQGNVGGVTGLGTPGHPFPAPPGGGGTTAPVPPGGAPGGGATPPWNGWGDLLQPWDRPFVPPGQRNANPGMSYTTGLWTPEDAARMNGPTFDPATGRMSDGSAPPTRPGYGYGQDPRAGVHNEMLYPTPQQGTPGYGQTSTAVLPDFNAPEVPVVPDFQAPTPFQAPKPFEGPAAFQYQNYDAPGRFTAPTMEEVQNTPGYQFRRDQGLLAREHLGARQGITRTLGIAKDLEQYGQDYASQEYEKEYARRAAEHDRLYGETLGEYQMGRGNARQDYDINYQNKANEYDRTYGNAANEWERNYGVAKNTYDTNRANTMADYDKRFQAAAAEYAPNVHRYDTETAAGQRQEELGYNRSWAEYLQKYDEWYRQQQNVFDRLRWQSEFGLNAAGG